METSRASNGKQSRASSTATLSISSGTVSLICYIADNAEGDSLHAINEPSLNGIEAKNRVREKKMCSSGRHSRFGSLPQMISNTSALSSALSAADLKRSLAINVITGVASKQHLTLSHLIRY